MGENAVILTKKQREKYSASGRRFYRPHFHDEQTERGQVKQRITGLAADAAALKALGIKI